MSNPGQYLLTGMLTIMLVIAPFRSVMALSMSIEDQCVSMVDHGNDLQQPGQTPTDPDNDHCNQVHGQGCCDDNDNTCATDCHACTSRSYAAAVTSPAKTALQHISISGFIARAVPLHGLAPLLRPPVTLHS